MTTVFYRGFELWKWRVLTSVRKTLHDQFACGAEKEPLPITLLARCCCTWQHAVCRVNHPSGMSIVSPHGTYFLLILTGMRLDVENTLFLHPLPLPHLCRVKSKVRQLRSQAHRNQTDELTSRSLQDTCPPPDNSYSCCCLSHNTHYRSYSPACPHPHYSIIKTQVFFSHSCCLYKLKDTAIPLQTLTGPEGSRRLRLPDFKKIGKWRW
jgi:hypothetical protein